jgi:hypothetical protein
MWKLGSVCLETMLVSMQDGCMVSPNIPQAWKSFWMNTVELLGDVGHVEFCFGPYGDTR